MDLVSLERSTACQCLLNTFTDFNESGLSGFLHNLNAWIFRQ
jgi:hypothetical protein